MGGFQSAGGSPEAKKKARIFFDIFQKKKVRLKVHKSAPQPPILGTLMPGMPYHHRDCQFRSINQPGFFWNSGRDYKVVTGGLVLLSIPSCST